MNGRHIIVLASLEDKAPKLLLLNSMDIGKTRVLTYESIYWVNMNDDIEKAIKMPHMP